MILRKVVKNKRGAFTDLFLFMITAFVIVIVFGMMIYLSTRVYTELKENTAHMTDKSDAEGQNITQVIDYSMGRVVASYQSLYWISILLIFGMIISIFIGSYMVTTRPVFFIPYFFMLIIVLIISVVISNVYEDIIATPELTDTFVKFWGSNFILLYLPVWMTIIGFTGAIIMYSRIGRPQGVMYG